MRFFKTVREKVFILKSLKRGNCIPLFKYILFRARFSRFFLIKRDLYQIPVWYTPYAYWLWTHESVPKVEELFFASFLHKGDVVIDGGAHIGTLSSIASDRVGDNGKVFTFEAHPRLASYCRKTLLHRKNVEVHNVALGNKNEPVPFEDEYVSDMNHVTETGTIEVEMRSLDSFFAASLPSVTLLKLDIEGQELPALKGAKAMLASTSSVLFESAPKSFAREGYSLFDVLSFLREHGFLYFYAIRLENGTLTYTQVYDSHVTIQKYENILAVRDTHILNRSL